jgi:hypothetical protein
LAVKRSQKTRKAAGKTVRKIKKTKRSTKQRKRIVKSSNSKHEDLGRLDFREYAVARRERLQAERLEYEKGFLARYKKLQKIRPKRKQSKQLKLDIKPKRNIKQERKEYERKYVSKFKKLQKTKLKIAALEQKLRLSQIELEEPKPSIKQKRGEYEKEYITRYSKQQKAKPKKKVFAIR